MINLDIGEYDCEGLWNDFAALRTDYQEHHGRVYDVYRIGTKQSIKTDPKSFFLKYFDLKKERVVCEF
jgi:hypothetical protein